VNTIGKDANHHDTVEGTRTVPGTATVPTRPDASRTFADVEDAGAPVPATTTHGAAS